MDIFKIALIIFATRIIDLICMPAIGLWLDKLNLNRVYRKKIIYISLPLIALSFNFLIFPLLPTAINLFVFSLTTHLLLTIIIISYYAISVEMTSNYKKQNKVSACREFFKAIGVVIAVLFPTGIMTEKYGFEASYNSLIIVLVVALFVAGILMNFVKAKSTVTFHFKVRPKVITDVINSKRLAGSCWSFL
jgi:Na+/melibiose symporter-like transporter